MSDIQEQLARGLFPYRESKRIEELEKTVESLLVRVDDLERKRREDHEELSRCWSLLDDHTRRLNSLSRGVKDSTTHQGRKFITPDTPRPKPVYNYQREQPYVYTQSTFPRASVQIRKEPSRGTYGGITLEVVRSNPQGITRDFIYSACEIEKGSDYKKTSCSAEISKLLKEGRLVDVDGIIYPG